MSFPNMPVHVNVIWDPTLGTNFHFLWGPPPIIPPAPGTPIPSFEMITTQMWTAGFLLGQNKFTKKTFHKGVFMCIADHDIGTLIPDVTIPPTNVYYPIMWPFSGRKITFMASTVKMESKPTSCSQIFPPIPMMTCGDPVTLPLAFPVANLINNVTVGLSFADFVLGWVKVVVSIAIDAIFEWGPVGKFFKKVGGKLMGTASSFAGAFVREAAGKLGLTPGAAAKRAVNALAGLATSTYEGNPTLSFKLGGGLVPEVGVQAGGDAKDVTGGTVFGIPVGATTGNMPTSEQINILR